MSYELKIRTAGDVFGHELQLSTECCSCGEIFGGVGIKLANGRAGFVMSWEDFEAAYHALAKVRATEEFQSCIALHLREREECAASDSGCEGT